MSSRNKLIVPVIALVAFALIIAGLFFYSETNKDRQVIGMIDEVVDQNSSLDYFNIDYGNLCADSVNPELPYYEDGKLSCKNTTFGYVIHYKLETGELYCADHFGATATFPSTETIQEYCDVELAKEIILEEADKNLERTFELAELGGTANAEQVQEFSDSSKKALLMLDEVYNFDQTDIDVLLKLDNYFKLMNSLGVPGASQDFYPEIKSLGVRNSTE